MSNIFLFIGPSGSGKTTVVRGLLQAFPEASEVVSTTTRPIRPGEIDGRDYYFTSLDTFRKNELYGAFAETVEFAGHAYGIYKSEIAEKLMGGDVFIIVNENGATQLKKSYPEPGRVITLYLEPATTDERLSRLKERGDFKSFDTDEEVSAQFVKRTVADSSIIKFKDKADHRVVSTTREATMAVCSAIILHTQMYGSASQNTYSDLAA